MSSRDDSRDASEMGALLGGATGTDGAFLFFLAVAAACYAVYGIFVGARWAWRCCFDRS